MFLIELRYQKNRKHRYVSGNIIARFVKGMQRYTDIIFTTCVACAYDYFSNVFESLSLASFVRSFVRDKLSKLSKTRE